MSRPAKLTLLGTSLFAGLTVAFVHWQQKSEKQAMHQGVVRDIEQQRVKRERQLDFDMQRELEAEYKKDQTVRNTASAIGVGNSGGSPGTSAQTTAPTAAGR